MIDLYNNIRKVYRISGAGVLLTATAIGCGGCSSTDAPDYSGRPTDCRKVAIILPGGENSSWRDVADMAVDNYHDACRVVPDAVGIDLEWKDENDADLDEYLARIANDDSYAAIIGPYRSADAGIAVSACKKSQKPVLLPLATSVDFQRMNAGKDYVWNLAESDITQCELLLSQLALSGINTASLLTAEGEYGQSFIDWFSYQAVESGLEVGDIVTYHDPASLRDGVKSFSDSRYNYSGVIFVPGEISDLSIFDQALSDVKRSGYPTVLCTDLAFSADLQQTPANRIEGISPSADPSCGFINAFRQRYGRMPMAGEAQVFDAISLLGYALTRNSGGNLNEDIRAIVDGRDPWGQSWMSTDMGEALMAIRGGGSPDLNGVTGDWTFDQLHHASPINTSYCHWVLTDGEYRVLEYVSRDGSGRTTSTKQIWDEENRMFQQFNASQEDLKYGAKSGNYAVVVGASDTWADYRHQADALAMYDMLRCHGYDDDHIILIIADNIAYDPHNLYPGCVRVRPEGKNLYADVKVDYRLGEISVGDLRDILLGNRSDRCPVVLGSGSADNLLFFWCGHGSAGKVAWGSADSIYGYQLADIFKAMAGSGKFRKLFLSMDTCYSGSVGLACENIPGLLVMTSARANEPSKADVKDPEMGIWLSNGFTRVFQETIDRNPDISVSDLYYEVARHTTGSHATVYNLPSYGNAYTNSMSEFFPDLNRR